MLTALLGALPLLASAADINVNLGSVRVDAPVSASPSVPATTAATTGMATSTVIRITGAGTTARVAKSTTPAAATREFRTRTAATARRPGQEGSLLISPTHTDKGRCHLASPFHFSRKTITPC